MYSLSYTSHSFDDEPWVPGDYMDVSFVYMICNALLPNEVLGSMGGGFLGESNLKKLFVTVCNDRDYLAPLFS